MRAYTEVDDDQWALTETILDNPPSGTCSPWVFLRTNAPSAAVPQSDAFCHVPTFVTTGAPPGNRTIM